MAFQALPSWGSPKLKSELNRRRYELGNRSAGEPPRLICRGRIGEPAEFVIDVNHGTEQFLQPILAGQQPRVPVDVFGRDGKMQAFTLRRDANDTYVFEAREPLRGTIICNDENIDNGIELSGYLLPPHNLCAFVLTVGLFPR